MKELVLVLIDFFQLVRLLYSRAQHKQTLSDMQNANKEFTGF